MPIFISKGNLIHKSRRDINAETEENGQSGNTVGKKKKSGWFSLLFGSDEDNNKDKNRDTDPFLDWQPGDTCYWWYANGMLGSVLTPEGKTVYFGYDALGRRVSKTVEGTVRRYGWDGNVLLHEWEISEKDRPKIVTDDSGREVYNGTEKPENLVTWVYDGQSFTPVAKVTEQERYTIIHDYLGTPTQAYDGNGELVWEMVLDVYGEVNEYNGERTLIPFRYQGQYEDEETGLYYNRFRYYSPQMGMYISQDPIGLEGNNPTLYGYVSDTNIWLDVWGLNVFWSGSSPALEAARVFTSNNPGRVVLEDTSKGIKLTNITKEMDWIDAKPLWNNASAEFAKNAVADFNAGKISHVDVFINDAHYSGSISVWESVEKPILVKNNIPIVEHHINVKCA